MDNFLNAICPHRPFHASGDEALGLLLTKFWAAWVEKNMEVELIKLKVKCWICISDQIKGLHLHFQKNTSEYVGFIWLVGICSTLTSSSFFMLLYTRTLVFIIIRHHHGSSSTPCSKITIPDPRFFERYWSLITITTASPWRLPL